jgi:hypothetical protein
MTDFAKEDAEYSAYLARILKSLDKEAVSIFLRRPLVFGHEHVGKRSAPLHKAKHKAIEERVKDVLATGQKVIVFISFGRGSRSTGRLSARLRHNLG